MRKIGLVGAVALALWTVSSPAATLNDLTAPVEVTGGTVVGVVADGIASFKGIPFAAPPVRDNRWRDPQPVKAWDGDLIADRYSPMCMQPLRSKNSVFYLGEEAVSEDCLYLNLWTASDAKPGDERPVMVFIYGGGWVVGSGSMPLYSGEGLARKGAVVINFNYRLGTLGFLSHPELTAESPDNSSGNYGLKDMLAALKWVKANAAAFGGDPERVTVYGQSAGAAAISLLMASPEATGLFQAAIGESGGYGMSRQMPMLDEAEKQGVAFMEKAKAKSLADLRNMGGDAIIAADNSFRPIVDNRVFKEQPSTTYAEGRQMPVPLLAGSNADESTVYPVVKPADVFIDNAKSTFGNGVSDFLKLYPAGNDEEARASSYNLHRDRIFASSVMDWAADQSKVAPTFVYYFDRPHPFAEGLAYQQQGDAAAFGAYHGAEMAYAFDALDVLNWNGETRKWTKDDRKLAGTLSSYWSNFARTGSPNGEGLVDWPRFDPEAQDVLLIGEAPRVGPFPNRALLDVLKSAAAQ